MVATTSLVAVAFAAASAFAAPAEDLNKFPKFQLQAKVTKQVPGAPHTNFEGLYVVPYHVAAGANAATLSATKPTSYFYLNGTQLQQNQGGEFPATTYGTRDTYNDAWGKVEINNIGPFGSYSFFQSFSIDKKAGLVGSSVAPGQSQDQNAFGGWRACDWDLNTAQLFFKDRLYKPSLPANCADIKLIPAYIP